MNMLLVGIYSKLLYITYYTLFNFSALDFAHFEFEVLFSQTYSESIFPQKY